MKIHSFNFRYECQPTQVRRWAIDRVGRSLIDLLSTIQHLEATGVDLYLDQQNVDTTTPMGRLLFQATGALPNSNGA